MKSLDMGRCLVVTLALTGCAQFPQDGFYSLGEDVQVEYIKSVKSIADKLVSGKALGAGDRIALVKLGFFLKDPAAEALFDDSLTSGLLKHKVSVLQHADINPLLFRQAAVGVFDLGYALERQRGFSSHLKELAAGIGATKLVLYRWIYFDGGQFSSVSTEPPTSSPLSNSASFERQPIRNRVFVRVVDPQTSAVLWSDYLESALPPVKTQQAATQQAPAASTQRW